MESVESEAQVSNEQIEKNRSIQTATLRSNFERNDIQTVRYPKRVFFIVAAKFCEQLNYYGISAVLVLYLKWKLGYTENDATVLYHGFTMLRFSMCIFGGILSDVWLGRFRTILFLLITYSIGSATVAISSIPNLDISPKVTLIVGLTFIAIGSGGIKPCIGAFGGDQYKLPEQGTQLAQFFSMFFFAMCLASSISTTIAPIFREDVQCFGQTDCFPLAFGVPAVLMLVSIVFFIAGKTSYTCKETSSENMLVQISKCIMNAISTKFRERRGKPHENLLDYSIDKYGEQLVGDIRTLLRILILYLPLPLFWALYDQQGSRWTFQATRMNGDIGFYTIKPDQIHLVNSVLVLMFIPLFEAVVYPILRKVGIRRPLQKMVMGGMLTAVSFFLSALVQYKIESSPEKSMSMLWLVPQYFALSAGEVMFSITGVAFSYEQAPESMKSVVQAFWQLTVSFGNLILLAITKMEIFDSQANEFLLFSGLMFVGMLIFAALARNFKSDVRIKMDSKDLEQCIPLEEKTR